MKAGKKIKRKPNSSAVGKRRLAQKQSSALQFETLEPRCLLAAITVTSATDILSPTANTSSIASLIANDGGDGISLREAIAAADSTPGEDVITFDAGVFTGGDNSLIRLTQGELQIADGLTIDGSSVGGVVITGDANDDDITLPGRDITDVSSTIEASDDLLDDNSRVLYFSGASGDLTLSGLTITGGWSLGYATYGSGIQFVSSGTVTLERSAVTGNIAMGELASAAGISTESGNVVLTHSTVSDNYLNGSYIAWGAGIFTESGAVSLTYSTVSGDTSTGGNVQWGAGILTLDGNVLLNGSTVSGNTITSRNAFFGAGGAGIGSTGSSGTVSLTNSTVSGNSAQGEGGGIFANGDISLTNSTVSGNSSGRDGGAIWSRDATVLLVNSTVTGNSSSEVGGGISLHGSNASLILHNSIVEGNSDDGTAPNISIDADVVNEIVVENSLIDDTTGSGITSTTGSGNILNQPALLGPLADNGGPTLTHALLPGSPAIDAGSNALAVDENGITLTGDQRGENRLESGTVDIGAFEFDAVDPFLLGDVSQDGVVDFSDIGPFIDLLSGNSFLDEADIDRSGVVDFSDIGPFIDVLSGDGGSTQANLISDNQAAVSISSGSAVIESPAVLLPAIRSSPLVATKPIPALLTTVVTATPVNAPLVPAVFASDSHRSFSAFNSKRSVVESKIPSALPGTLAGFAQHKDFTDELGDEDRLVSELSERTFTNAADLLDTHPEFLDEIFDFGFEELL